MASFHYLDARPILQPQSGLLRLPAELRNKIYHYVLHEDNIAMIARDINDPRSPCHLQIIDQDRHWQELNQLKYVCRQLYFETRDLNLSKHTDLVFPLIRSVNYSALCTPWEQAYYPPAACARFLKACAPGYLAQLHSVEIHLGPLEYLKFSFSCSDVMHPALPGLFCSDGFFGSRMGPADLSALQDCLKAHPNLHIYVKGFWEGYRGMLLQDELTLRENSMVSDPPFLNDL
jgi:hypothetical protein